MSNEHTEMSRENGLKIVRENRDAFERLAATDLPIAQYCQNALDELEEAEES